MSLHKHVKNLQDQVAAITSKLSKFNTPPRRFDMEPLERIHSLTEYGVDIETGTCLLNVLDSVGKDNVQALDKANVRQPGVRNTAVVEAIAFF